MGSVSVERGGMGQAMGWRLKMRVYMYTYGWFMLRFDRKQPNSVKQLSSNKTISLKKESFKDSFKDTWDTICRTPNIELQSEWACNIGHVINHDLAFISAYSMTYQASSTCLSHFLQKLCRVGPVLTPPHYSFSLSPLLSFISQQSQHWDMGLCTSNPFTFIQTTLPS